MSESFNEMIENQKRTELPPECPAWAAKLIDARLESGKHDYIGLLEWLETAYTETIGERPSLEQLQRWIKGYELTKSSEEGRITDKSNKQR